MISMGYEPRCVNILSVVVNGFPRACERVIIFVGVGYVISTVYGPYNVTG
jgi:hypothetical protein